MSETTKTWFAALSTPKPCLPANGSIVLLGVTILGLLLTACAAPQFAPPASSQQPAGTISRLSDDLAAPATALTSSGALRGWHPLQMQANSYYHYQLYDATDDQQGNLHLTIGNSARNRLNAHWEIHHGPEPRYVADIVDPNNDIMQSSHTVLLQSAQTRIVAMTILNPWWQTLSMAEFQHNSVTHLPYEQSTLTLHVKKECRINRHRGVDVELYHEQRKLARACIASDIPLPIKVITYDARGARQQTAELSIYRLD